MRIENERLKRALEVSLEQEWRTMPEESEIWKMHRFSPGFLEKMQRLQEEAQETEQKMALYESLGDCGLHDAGAAWDRNDACKSVQGQHGYSKK